MKTKYSPQQLGTWARNIEHNRFDALGKVPTDALLLIAWRDRPPSTTAQQCIAEYLRRTTGQKE